MADAREPTKLESLKTSDAERDLQAFIATASPDQTTSNLSTALRNKTDTFLHERLDAVIPERVENALQAPNGQLRLLQASHDKLDERLGVQSAAFQQLEVRAETLKSSIQDVEKAYDAFKIAISERIALQGVSDLWRNRARVNRRTFVISAIVLVLLLIAGPAALILYKSEILKFIHDVEMTRPGTSDNGLDYLALVGRIAFVSVPILFYIWIIKLVGRFNARSLLLMDDAAQRSTMLDTYLYLIQKDADVTEERKTVLEALFRAAPGYGSDSNEPVAIADLLRIAGQQQR